MCNDTGAGKDGLPVDRPSILTIIMCGNDTYVAFLPKLLIKK